MFCSEFDTNLIRSHGPKEGLVATLKDKVESGCPRVLEIPIIY